MRPHRAPAHAPARLSHPHSPKTLSTTVIAAITATAGVVPVFIVGSLAVLIRADLEISRFHFGLVVSAFWASSALSAIPLGRLAQRIPPSLLTPIAAGILGLTLGTLALSQEILHIALSLILAGCAGAALQLSISRILTESIPLQRQGLAFGIKQAAVPLGTLVSGVAVSLAASQFGWRLTTAAVGVLVAFGVPLIRRWSSSVAAPSAPRARVALARKRALLTLSIIGACGGFSGTSMATFVVEFLVESRIDVWLAGVILTAASLVTIVARIGLGWFLDYFPVSPAPVMAIIMTLGGAMLVALWIPLGPLALAVLVVFAYAMAWSWPGALLYIVARIFPKNVASASGVVQGFVWTGATSGPVVSAILITSFGFQLTWILLGSVLLLGAIVVFANVSALTLGNHSELAHTA